MLVNDTAVRLIGHGYDIHNQPIYTYGYAVKLVHASQGERWWAVDWEDGTHTVCAEKHLIDVDREEYLQALDGVPDGERCPSVYPRLGGRCGLKVGHRTRRHRSAEISWTNEMAQEAVQ